MELAIGENTMAAALDTELNTVSIVSKMEAANVMEADVGKIRAFGVRDLDYS